jgi:hypothetical protein
MTTIKIVQSPDVESPREWDNLGTMLCFHSRYNLGDEKAKEKLLEEIRNSKNYSESWEDDDLDDPVTLWKVALKANIIGFYMPLYLYDHGSITMATTPFSCNFDSGQVGFIYVTKEEIRNEYSVKRITKKVLEKVQRVCEGEVETFDQFIRNDVYGFQVIDADGEVGDSCYGFYGSDVEKNGMMEHVGEELHKALREAEISYD